MPYPDRLNIEFSIILINYIIDETLVPNGLGIVPYPVKNGVLAFPYELERLKSQKPEILDFFLYHPITRTFKLNPLIDDMRFPKEFYLGKFSTISRDIKSIILGNYYVAKVRKWHNKDIIDNKGLNEIAIEVFDSDYASPLKDFAESYKIHTSKDVLFLDRKNGYRVIE